MLVKERWDSLLWFGLLGAETGSRRMNSMNYGMERKGVERSSTHLVFKGSL